jgi:hypothetical protein
MDRILELAGTLQEGKEARVYIMNPGRHGWDRVAVKVGDQLVRENGDAGKFVRLDGNKIVMTNPAGKEIKVVPSDVACKILPAGQKPDKAFFESLELDRKQIMSQRILELAGVLQEAAEAKLYICNPMGNGYDRKAVKKGEHLTRENGDILPFERLDGNKVVLKSKDGKEIKASLKDVGGKILAAGQKADKAFFESLVVEAAGGKRQGAINMIATASGLDDVLGVAKDHDAFLKALGLAYDAGVADANKASSKQER